MDRFEITASDKSGQFTLFFHDKSEGAPKKLTAASFICANAECGETLIGNNSAVFGCPSCSTKMKANGTRDLVASDLKDLRDVGTCTFCDCKLVSASEGMADFKQGKLYCPVCTEVVTTVKADDSGANSAEDKDKKKDDSSEAEQEDMGPDATTAVTDDSGDDGSSEDETETNPDDLPEGEDESGEDSSEDNSSSEDDGSSEDGSAEDGSDDSKNADKTATADDGAGENGSGEGGNGGGDGEGKPKKDAVNRSHEDKPKDEKKPEDKAVSHEDKSADKPAETGEAKPASEIEASLLTAVSDKEVTIDLIATADRRKWYLMADNMPIAVAEKGRCSEGVREHFDTDKYAAAYHAASKDGATEDLLKEFGFEPIVTKVPVDEAVRQQVEAQVLEKTRAFQLNASEYNERATRCFGLAALGMVKGTWNDKNPVQEALVNTLHRVGVADAQNIVASAFEKHSTSLFKTLMLRADDLMDKEDNALSEVARIVEEQPTPGERSPRRGIPPAAMSVIEEERIDRASPKHVTASTSDETAGYDDIFRRRKSLRG